MVTMVTMVTGECGFSHVAKLPAQLNLASEIPKAKFDQTGHLLSFVGLSMNQV